MAERVVVLIVASGAAWEPEALRLLGDHPRIVVLKRCVDVDDLLAAATAGQADVAVVGLDAPGLDRAAVDHLRAHAVRPVAIAAGGATLDGGRLRAGRIGIPVVVTDDQLDTLADAICADDRPPTVVRRPVEPAPVGPPGGYVPRWPAGSSRSGDRPVPAAAPSPPRWPPRSPVGGAGSCSSTPTRTAGRSPSSSASSTRCPGCSPPCGWTPPASSSSGSGRCSAGSTST